MLKKEKGITLIALIVTIIVMLILAGVTISIALNNNGIFNRAKEGGKAYQNAATNEMRDLNTHYEEMTNIMNEYGLEHN